MSSVNVSKCYFNSGQKLKDTDIQRRLNMAAYLVGLTDAELLNTAYSDESMFHLGKGNLQIYFFSGQPTEDFSPPPLLVQTVH